MENSQNTFELMVRTALHMLALRACSDIFLDASLLGYSVPKSFLATSCLSCIQFAEALTFNLPAALGFHHFVRPVPAPLAGLSEAEILLLFA